MEKMKLHSLLLVEDEEDHAHFIMNVLTKEGIKFSSISWAKNGQEAINYITETENNVDIPSIIFLDIKMPIMNGFEVLKWLKSDDKYKTIPIVMLTTSGISEDIQRALKMGANDYIVKPAKWVNFKQKIKGLGKYWGFVSDSYNSIKN